MLSIHSVVQVIGESERPFHLDRNELILIRLQRMPSFGIQLTSDGYWNLCFGFIYNRAERDKL